MIWLYLPVMVLEVELVRLPRASEHRVRALSPRSGKAKPSCHLASIFKPDVLGVIPDCLNELASLAQDDTAYGINDQLMRQRAGGKSEMIGTLS